jgi:hypothetical protein
VDNLSTETSDILSAFREFLVGYAGYEGHIIITTRSSATVAGWASSLKIDHFADEEAVDLFFRLSRLKPDYDLKQVARKIIETLGGCPLSIELAAAHIRERFCNIHNFLNRYSISRRIVLRCIRENSEFKLSDYHFYATYISLATTWNISFQALRNEKIIHSGSYAFNLLRQLSAHAGADGIMTLDLGEDGEVIPPARLGLEVPDPSTYDFRAELTVLERLSLIRRSYNGLIISFHPLIQSVIKPERLAETRFPQDWDIYLPASQWTMVKPSDVGNMLTE